jgi:hypothetical protein
MSDASHSAKKQRVGKKEPAEPPGGSGSSSTADASGSGSRIDDGQVRRLQRRGL